MKLYMDHHVSRAISVGLRALGIDVLDAFEDNAHEFPDTDLLSRAISLDRILFTRDDDLLKLANQLQKQGISFPGVVFAHQLNASIGECIADLELIIKVGNESDVRDRVTYLPL